MQAPASTTPPAPAPAPIPAPASPSNESPSADVPDVPDDDDLRAWFGDGPLDAPSGPAASSQPGSVETAPDPAPPMEPGAVSGPEALNAAGNDAVIDASHGDSNQASNQAAQDPAKDGAEAASLDAPPAQEAPSPPEQALAPDFQAELERFAQTVRSSTSVAALPASAREDRAAQAREQAGARAAEVAEDDETVGSSVPGFMRQARRRAFWASPGVRAALGVVALVLAALLAAQWAIQQRHQLVASYPQTRPWMEQACAVIGCDLAPIRRIDAVEIESAELVRRLGNFYSFDFVLRNRSSLEVATPALELTLTGLGNQTMARRVFLPQDWPDAPTALPPGGTVSVSLRLALMLGDDAPTAGYRALAFYP